MSKEASLANYIFIQSIDENYLIERGLVTNSTMKQAMNNNIIPLFSSQLDRTLQKLNNYKGISVKVKKYYNKVIEKYIRRIKIYIYYIIKFFSHSKISIYHFNLIMPSIDIRNKKVYISEASYAIFISNANLLYEVYSNHHKLYGNVDLEFKLNLLKNVVKINTIHNSINQKYIEGAV
jgi:hypothetical protein